MRELGGTHDVGPATLRKGLAKNGLIRIDKSSRKGQRLSNESQIKPNTSARRITGGRRGGTANRPRGVGWGPVGDNRHKSSSTFIVPILSMKKERKKGKCKEILKRGGSQTRTSTDTNNT